MTKNEMIKAVQVVASKNMNVSDKEDYFSQKEIGAVIDALSTVVTDTMTTGGEITFPNVGKFKVKEVKERKGIIHMGERSGEEYINPAHKEPSFKLSSNFKKMFIEE